MTTDAIAEEVSLLADAFTAAELQHETFEPLREFIPGVVAEGFSILGGGPKMGKSYMGLDFSLANSMGGLALGCIPVEECDVLYLALEDSKAEIAGTYKAALASRPGLAVAFSAADQGSAGTGDGDDRAVVQVPPQVACHLGHLDQEPAATRTGS